MTSQQRPTTTIGPNDKYCRIVNLFLLLHSPLIILNCLFYIILGYRQSHRSLHMHPDNKGNQNDRLMTHYAHHQSQRVIRPLS